MAEEFGKGVVPFRRYGDRYLNYEAIAGGNEGSSAAQAQANTSSSDFGANIDGGPGTGQTMGGPGHGTQPSGMAGQPGQPQGFTNENPYSSTYGANVTQDGMTQTGVSGYGFRNKDLSNPSVPDIAAPPKVEAEEQFTDENPYSVSPVQREQDDSPSSYGYRGADSYGKAVGGDGWMSGKYFEGQQLPGLAGAALHQIGEFTDRQLDGIQQNAEAGKQGYNYGQFGNQRLGVSPGLGGFGQVYTGNQNIMHLDGLNVASQGNVANANRAIDIANTQPAHTTASGNVLYGQLGANKAAADQAAQDQGSVGGGTYLSAVTDTQGNAVKAGDTVVTAANSYVAPKEESEPTGPGTSVSSILSSAPTSSSNEDYAQAAYGGSSDDDSGSSGGK